MSIPSTCRTRPAHILPGARFTPHSDQPLRSLTTPPVKTVAQPSRSCRGSISPRSSPGRVFSPRAERAPSGSSSVSWSPPTRLSPEVPHMAELVRTNDPGIISVIEGLLGGADIPYQVTDRNMSVLEGSILAIQMRILVPDDHEAEARELLVDAELGNWLRP